MLENHFRHELKESREKHVGSSLQKEIKEKIYQVAWNKAN
jgi:hypothetical protein